MQRRRRDEYQEKEEEETEARRTRSRKMLINVPCGSTHPKIFHTNSIHFGYIREHNLISLTITARGSRHQKIAVLLRNVGISRMT
jgi:hypothetical protein